MFQYDDERTADTIGSILRRQRKSNRQDLEEIAKELKIKPEYLEALENDQFELLPGRLYQRSFLKSYAQFLDLDHDRILKMFDRLEKSQMPLGRESEGIKSREDSTKERPTFPGEAQSSRSRAGYQFAIFAGLALGIFCMIYLAKPGMKKGYDSASELSAAVAESLTTEEETVDTTSFAWRLDNLLTNSPQMTLRIEAHGDSWVKIVADKKNLFSGFIATEMAVEFKANDYFSIHLGKNEGVEMYLNGMKMRALEKGIHRLDRTSYKTFFEDIQTP